MLPLSKISFSKNKTELKMEISHKHFDESCELKLIEELKIKYKTVMSVAARQREKKFFCNIYFV